MSGPQCCSNPPTLNPNAGAGHVEQLGGLSTYVSGSPNSKLAILLITDVFGYEAPNFRKLADKVAAAGFFVVVPDFLHGDPVTDLSDPKFDLDTWMKAHNTEKGFEDAKPVIEALKSKGFSAIGAAGFCWGAMVLVKLASSTDLQAAVLLHPGWIPEDEINNVKIPISILGAEIDHYSPPEILKQFGKKLSEKSEFDSFVKIYPGVAHGWTVRYNVEDESAVKSAEEAHLDMLNWFTKKLADKVAASGFYVVVPDFFHGEPFVLDNANRPIQVWLKDHGPDKGFEEAKPVIEALKSKGVSAVGAAGFCWGAKGVVELAKAELIQAAVLLHPSFVTPDDIKGVKVSIAVLGAENDQYSPPELLKQFEEVLAAKSEVDGFVKIFPKVEHGWTIRYSVEDAAAVKSAEEAHQNLLEWFAKYVK